MSAYDDITESFHDDLAKEDYAGFGKVDVTPTGRVHFDSSIEDGLLVSRTAFAGLRLFATRLAKRNNEDFMQNKALVVIDIQNDITKNYKDVIGGINSAIDWAVDNDIHVVYIRHENLSAGTRTFKPNTRGAELAPDLKMVSKNIFTKTKGNALTSEEFADFISKNEIGDFYIAGADAVACVKSTCYNLSKADYAVNVLSDCITSYDKRKIPEMLLYYESKGCNIISLSDLLDSINKQ